MSYIIARINLLNNKVDTINDEKHGSNYISSSEFFSKDF